jgi:FkbM family methyltransferase
VGGDTLTTYAQNGEDVVLDRAFAGRCPGFYVDVGAAGPVHHSVTKLFYDRGWRGINVEPLVEKHAELAAERPRDVNLNCAIAATRGRLPLTVVEGTESLSTLDAGVAEVHRGAGHRTRTVAIDVLPLDDVLAEHASEPIDFLKVDVEGHEREVLASVDLDRWRPSVVVVEATFPCTDVPTHECWEPLLLGAGYRLGLFDGLNRFYAAPGEDELLRRLRRAA